MQAESEAELEQMHKKFRERNEQYQESVEFKRKCAELVGRVPVLTQQQIFSFSDSKLSFKLK